MKLRHLLISAATFFAVANSAGAIEMQPLRAQSIDLGDVAGTAYYLVEAKGYRVVATLARAGGGAPPVRVEALLAPGQSVSVSTPREFGFAAESIEFERRDDKVIVEKGPLTH